MLVLRVPEASATLYEVTGMDYDSYRLGSLDVGPWSVSTILDHYEIAMQY